MELSSDLKAVQSILRNAVNEIGDFTKIKFKGGNEENILQLIMKIHEFLAGKKYIEIEKPNRKFDNQLNDIVFFLAINTEFKCALEKNDSKNLIGLVPPLSKCLLVNLLFGLNLVHQYCNIIERLPIRNAVELLDEAIQCLKKLSPENNLHLTTLILRASHKKLANTEYCSQYEDDIDDMSEVINLMLMNTTGLYFKDPKDLKSTRIYKLMGICLLSLLNLLLDCNKDCLSLSKFIKNIMRVTTFILRCVTLDVFCSWSEIEEDDEVLQSKIAEAAYKVMQYYDQYNGAMELIGVLKNIARKPKSVAEKIRNADVVTKIKNVYKAEEDQIKWFQALLANFHNITRDKEALACIKDWSHLCNDDDITYLLNMYVLNHERGIIEIILKSASTLTLEKLLLVCKRHFYPNKFSHILADDLQTQLLSICNQNNPDFTKELVFMLLQNPRQVLKFLFMECLKESSQLESLNNFFDCTKEILRIDNFGICILFEVIKSKELDEKNAENCVKLLRKVNCFSEDIIWKELFLPLLKEFREHKFNNVGQLLTVILETNVKLFLCEENMEVVEFLLDFAHASRPNFLHFSGINELYLKYTIDIIMDLCEANDEVELPSFQDDCYIDYYIEYLSGNRTASFLQCLCKDFDVQNHGKSVAKILKILPRCVTREWLMVAEELIRKCGYVKCVEILTDVLLLLSELVQSQMIESVDESMAQALRQCRENYSAVLLQKILPNTTLEEEKEINKLLCRLLSKLPDSMKELEGLAMVTLFTERSMKTLATNKDFLCRLMLIKNAKICKLLVDKITK